MNSESKKPPQQIGVAFYLIISYEFLKTSMLQFHSCFKIHHFIATTTF